MSARGTSRTRRGPWVITLVVAIAIGALAGGLLIARARRLDPRQGSDALGDGPPVTIIRTPTSYRIVYRETITGAAGDVVNTEIVSVRRPFDSRRATLAGAPPGARQLDEQISTLTLVQVRPALGDSTTFPVAPGVAPFDVRLDARLGERLIQLGVLEMRERRQVAGRTCQVYRSSGALDAAITPIASGATSYSDTCIDEAGLVLEEVAVDGGTMRRRSVAVSVEEEVLFTDTDFAVEATPTIPASKGGGSAVALDPASPTIAVTLSLATPPGGFSFRGRYAVASPAAVNAAGEPTGDRTAAVFDVYTRGPDYVAIEEGGTVSGSAPFSPSPLRSAVDLGPLGNAEVVPGTRQSELRILFPRGRYVRLLGTVSPDDLVALARQLRPAPTT